MFAVINKNAKAMSALYGEVFENGVFNAVPDIDGAKLCVVVAKRAFNNPAGRGSVSYPSLRRSLFSDDITVTSCRRNRTEINSLSDGRSAAPCAESGSHHFGAASVEDANLIFGILVEVH